MKFLIFLPEHELHELMILFANYLVKSRHHKTIYLGQNIPFSNLKPVVEKTKPDCLLASFTSYPSADNTLGYLQLLSGEFPDQKIFVSGQRVTSMFLPLPENVKRLEDFSELLAVLEP